MNTAARGFDAVEAIERRLNDAWTDKPEDLPHASGFLRREAAGQRNRIVAFLIAETPAPSVGGRAASVQVVTAELGLLLLLPRRNDRGGERARVKAEVWTDAVRKRLIGWTPEGFYRPFVWGGGALESDDDDDYWVWVDRYRTEWTMDSQRFSAD